MLDVKKIKQDFAMFQNHPDMIYLDNSATTFKPAAVVQAIAKYNQEESVNIERGDYLLSHEVSTAYENARATTARFINAKQAEEVVFTSGATDSLNMVAYGLMDKLHEDDVILLNYAEHASNILCWFDIAKQKGCKIDYLPLAKNGKLVLADLEAKLQQHQGRVKIVSMAYISNVLGYKQDIKAICQMVHQYHALMIVDGAQSVPHIKTDVQDLDVDFLAFSGHKMCGPTGIGVLYGKFALLDDLKPLRYGGGANARFDIAGNVILQTTPHKFEAGTPNIAGALGLEAAIKYLENIGMDKIEAYEEQLKKYMVSKISALPNIHCYNADATTGILAFNAHDVFSQDAGSYLNTKNICIRSGNHCAKILHNLIGTDQTCRASLYFYNTYEDIDAFVEACKDLNVENCIDIFF
ncbi:MAG: cysteine desulfurase [Erysipelotrichaceae bacterium]|nr:cysteine desulfurase [Erysipelotrichaceae bacterium]MDY5251362.1 cysteine desulfurase [Erysipelotrichaceae bacterium]